MCRKRLTISSAFWILMFAVPLLLPAVAAVDPITGAEPGEGYGANVTGGYGKPVVNVTTFAQLQNAIKQNNVYIKVHGTINATSNALGSGSNITIDGQGTATLIGNRSQGQRMLELYGSNIVIRDIRLRESGDNLSLKSANGVLISHVSTTGATDDGMSLGYGSQNVTVQYSFFCGNTRSCFIKYNSPRNITIHHNWFKAQWIRGPLVSGVTNMDVRNHLLENWWSWGGPRFEDGSTGNCVNSRFIMTGVTPGKTDAADYTYGTVGPVYFHGSSYTGCSGRPGTSATEIPCAPVNTESPSAAETNIRANAGCLPRDGIDLAYMAATSWPSLGDTKPWIISQGDVGPTCVVTGPQSPTSTAPINFTINFSESVTGLTAGEIIVTNGIKGTLTGSGSGPYILPVTPEYQGAVTCKVPAGAAQSGTGKNNIESNTLSIIYEGSVAPSCTVTGPASPTSNSPINFTINFSAPVTGLTAGEIVVTNGSKGSLTGSGAGPYTLPVTPSQSGQVTCKVPANSAQDALDRGNLESNTYVVVWEDPNAPTCTVTGPSSPTNSSPINFTINFSASVTGLTAGEIVVTNGSKGTLTGSGSGPYTLPVTPSGQGAVTCQVPAGAAQDNESRGNKLSNLLSITYDSVAPSATVTGPASPTNNNPINFTINFSEPVTGLTAGDITVTNGSKGTLTGSGSGPYTMPVTPSGQGPVTCKVEAGSAQDAAGNTNTVSNTRSITYDSVAPTATVAAPDSPTYASPIHFTINFSESVTGLTAAKITVTNGTKGALTGGGSGPYTLSVTPSEGGEVTCQVPSNSAQDAAGNGNTVSNTANVTYIAPEALFGETWGTRSTALQITGAEMVLTPQAHDTDHAWHAILLSPADPGWRLIADTSDSMLRNGSSRTVRCDASFRSSLAEPVVKDEWTSFTLSWDVRFSDNGGTVDLSRWYLYLAADGGTTTGETGVATVPSNGLVVYQNLPAAGYDTFGGFMVVNNDVVTSTAIGNANPVRAKTYSWTATFSKYGSNTRVKYTVLDNGNAFLSGETIVAGTLSPSTVFDRVVIRGEDCARVRNERIDNIVIEVSGYGPSEREDYSEWEHQETLTFTGYSGSESLVDFPVLVRLDADRFPLSEFEEDGADLRFADVTGNPLPYEIEAWNVNGESLIWVLVPEISSSDDFIRMYWGKPGAASAADAGAVWTNGFLGVWHLGDNFQDSTAAERDATNYGSTLTAGLLGGGASFDGNDYVSIPANAGSSEEGSLSVWIKTSTDFNNLAHVFYMRGPGGTSGAANPGDGLGGQNELHVNFTTNDALQFFIEGEVGTSNELDVYITTQDAYNTGDWYHVAATWDKAGEVCNLYVDGELVGTTEHIGRVFDFSQFIALGKPETDNRYYTGLMDEARQCGVARSEDWIQASYQNQRPGSTFIQYERGEAEDLSTWARQMELRFAGYDGIAEPVIDFPVLVRLDSGLFPPEQFEANGADLRFADAEGNVLPYEIEAWDENDESLIWVLVPSISSEDDYIQMYWGKAGVEPGADPAAVWANGFLGVWHLGDNYQDSTSAERGATNYGSILTAGLLGGGASFDGDDYVSIPANAGSSEEGSLSVWIKTSTDFNNLAHVFYMRGPGGTSGAANPGDGLGGQNELHVNFTANDALQFFIEGEVGTSNDLDVYITTQDAYNTGDWYHVAATWDKAGEVCNLYVDGELVGTTEHIGRVFDFSQFIALGKPETDNRYYTGLMDEARQCGVTRSAAWIKASYRNQAPDSTFIQYAGSEELGPTTVVTGPASPTNVSPIEFTINFSESVTGLTAEAIEVTNGSKGTLTGSGSGPYTLPVTPSAQGSVTCKVPADAAQTADERGNRASNTLSVTYDSVAPTCEVTGPPSPTKNSPIQFTIYFSEPVTGLTASNITVTNGSKGTLTGSGSGPYALPVTPSGQGAVTCQVQADAAEDAAGNGNTVSNNLSVVYDSVAPTVTVTGPNSPTYSSPIEFTINFSEPVTGLSDEGITVTNGTKGTLDGSGAGPYTLAVTPTEEGEVTCQVQANAAEDAAGNGNTVSNTCVVEYEDATVPVEVFNETWGTRSSQLNITGAGMLLTPQSHNTDQEWLAVLLSPQDPQWRLINSTSDSMLRNGSSRGVRCDASFRSYLDSPIWEDDWTSFTLSWTVRFSDNGGIVDVSRWYFYLAADGGTTTGQTGVATIPSNGLVVYQNLPATGYSTFGGFMVVNDDVVTSTTIGNARPQRSKTYDWTATFSKDGDDTRVKYAVLENGSPLFSGSSVVSGTIAPETVFDRVVIRGEDCARVRNERIDNIRIEVAGLPE